MLYEVITLTGPVGMAAYKAPSILAMEIQIKGKAAHAGFAPEEGVHAIAVAAKAISELKLGHIDEETTQNIGIIHGGLMSNIVPESCSIKGEVRSYDHEKAVRETEKTKARITSYNVCYTKLLRVVSEVTVQVESASKVRSAEPVISSSP